MCKIAPVAVESDELKAGYSCLRPRLNRRVSTGGSSNRLLSFSWRRTPHDSRGLHGPLGVIHRRCHHPQYCRPAFLSGTEQDGACMVTQEPHRLNDILQGLWDSLKVSGRGQIASAYHPWGRYCFKNRAILHKLGE